MSYEGYEQHICEKVHLFNNGDIYSGEDPLCHCMSNAIEMGKVVTLDGNRRRYVLASFCKVDQSWTLLALSGTFAGCCPSGIKTERLTLSDDQNVEFTGAEADYLRRRFAQFRVRYHLLSDYDKVMV